MSGDSSDMMGHPSSHGFDSQPYPFQTPPMPGLPAVPPGWFLSPQTGWYYVPPNQSLSSSSSVELPHQIQAHNYPHLPQFSASAAYGNPLTSQRYDLAPNHQQVPLYPESPSSESFKPKGILKTSSDPVSSSRQVRFRDTPDIAPSLSQASSLSSLPNGDSPSTPQHLPPWSHDKLFDTSRRKSSPRHRIDEYSPARYHDHIDGSMDENELPHSSQNLSRPAYFDRHDGSTKGIEEVPTSLRIAHDRLFRIGDSTLNTSGKRRGKNLIRELERLAEAAVNGHDRRQVRLDPPRATKGLNSSTSVDGEAHQDWYACQVSSMFSKW
jgi:hypothetical protein